MKLCFRTVAAFSTGESTALPVVGLLILILVLYTGFAIPIANIVGAFRWITHLNVRAMTCLSLSSVLMLMSRSKASPLRVRVFGGQRIPHPQRDVYDTRAIRTWIRERLACEPGVYYDRRATWYGDCARGCLHECVLRLLLLESLAGM